MSMKVGNEDKYDTRFLAWGGYLNYADQKSNKENRWILCVNTGKKEIFITQHETDQAGFPFDSIMCVFGNLKYPTSLIIFFNNGKEPLNFFLDSEPDRNELIDLISAIPKNQINNVIARIGNGIDDQRTCSKKGKLKWAERFFVVVKSRLLLFRDNETEFPLQMISLLEPNLTFEPSNQHEKSIQINCQERAFHFQLSSDNEVKDFIDKLERLRTKLSSEAKADGKLKQVQFAQSRRDLVHKQEVVRQQASKMQLTGPSKRNLNSASNNQPNEPVVDYTKVHEILINDDSSTKMDEDGNQSKGFKPGLKFKKPFNPQKQQTSVFLWGRARPSRLFPQHANQASPFRHEQLSQKRFVYIAAAKDGTHAFGFTDNDWSFVWGESEYPGALGLGRDTKSTLPYLLKPLKRKNIIQIACSSRHGIAITASSEIFGWGFKSLTGLPADVTEPKPLNFLANLGVTNIACSNTHSSAWHHNTSDVFTWGMPGSWLGLENNDKPFGKVAFDNSIKQNNILVAKVECGNQYTLVLFGDGRVSAFGTNDHGRMGIGQETSETTEPVWVKGLPQIGDISAGPFHSAFLSLKGQVYTSGVGADFRLGHGNEDTQYIPKLVEALGETKVVRITCVEDRTFAITEWGCVLMWGVEPISDMVHTAPFVYEYMRPYRIYQICGAKDFTIALGVHSKEPVNKPDLEVADEPRLKRGKQLLDSTIADVVTKTAQVGDKGFSVKAVYGDVVQVEKNVYEDLPPPPSHPMVIDIPPPPNMDMRQSPQMNSMPPPPMGLPPMGLQPMGMGLPPMMNIPPPPFNSQQPPPPLFNMPPPPVQGFNFIPPPNQNGLPPVQGFNFIPPPPNQNGLPQSNNSSNFPPPPFMQQIPPPLPQINQQQPPPPNFGLPPPQNFRQPPPQNFGLPPPQNFQQQLPPPFLPAQPLMTAQSFNNNNNNNQTKTSNNPMRQQPKQPPFKGK